MFCDATSHVCIYEDDGIDFGYWSPDNVEDDAYKWPANVERDVKVFLVSREPTQQVGMKNVLLITARELCCGGGRPRNGIVDVVGITDAVGKALTLPPAAFTQSQNKVANLVHSIPNEPAAASVRSQNMSWGEGCSKPEPPACELARALSILPQIVPPLRRTA